MPRVKKKSKITLVPICFPLKERTKRSSDYLLKLLFDFCLVLLKNSLSELRVPIIYIHFTSGKS